MTNKVFKELSNQHTENLARQYTDFLAQDNGVYSSSHLALIAVMQSARGMGVETDVENRIDEILANS